MYQYSEGFSEWSIYIANNIHYFLFEYRQVQGHQVGTLWETGVSLRPQHREGSGFSCIPEPAPSLPAATHSEQLSINIYTVFIIYQTRRATVSKQLGHSLAAPEPPNVSNNPDKFHLLSSVSNQNAPWHDNHSTKPAKPLL